MEEFGKELVQRIQELSSLEINEKQIKYAIFNNKVKDFYNEKIKVITKDFDKQSDFFGKHIEEYITEKTKIMEMYNKEFEKIYYKRKEQYFSIETEIEELELNQKIVLNNIEKIYASRTKVLENKKCDIKAKVEQSEVAIKALVDKYEKYDALINECENKIDECISSVEKDFENIVKKRNVALLVPKKESIFEKLFGMFFSKKKKYKKEVIGKMNNEINEIQNSSEMVISGIEEQTIKVIAKIEEIKNNINLEFKSAI